MGEERVHDQVYNRTGGAQEPRQPTPPEIPPVDPELMQLIEGGGIFRILVQSATEFAILALDRFGRILTWNTGAERLFGYSVAEVFGQTADILFNVADQARGVPRQEVDSAMKGEIATDERWHLRRDGSTFFASGFMMPIRDKDGKIRGTVKVLRDLTAQRNAETERTLLLEQTEQARKIADKAREAAEHASEIKDQFVSILSHELRTPLTPILLILPELIADSRVPEEVRKDLELIQKNVEVETRLIDDLLDFRRIVSGKLMLRHEQCDVHLLVSEAAVMCKAGFSHKAVQLTLELQAANHDVMGDSVRLKQVFWNLVNNAFKFTPEGGSIHIRSFNPDSGSVAIQVKDTGIGIGSEVISVLFRPFRQEGTETARMFGGLGLGLTIAKEIVDLQHGSLVAVSEGRDKGAMFTVTLPLGAKR